MKRLSFIKALVIISIVIFVFSSCSGDAGDNKPAPVETGSIELKTVYYYTATEGLIPESSVPSLCVDHFELNGNLVTELPYKLSNLPGNQEYYYNLDAYDAEGILIASGQDKWIVVTGVTSPVTAELNVLHKHSFKNSWSKNNTHHWKETTCGHEAIYGKAEHTLSNYYYQCTVCGYEHNHTYSTNWSSDENKHWHASTCGHDVKTDESDHSFVNDVCSICGYINNWNITNSGIITPKSKTLITGTVNIPLKVSGITVSGIDNNAFKGCSNLTSISIPSSVTSIGDYAFEGCSGLTSISIPSSVTSIDQGAFKGCSGLTNISIPSSVTKIQSETFSGCSGLTSISIPSSVTHIYPEAFKRCSGLTNISIPSSVIFISSYAFYGCSGLTSISIPSSVTSIISSSFCGCSGLTSISIPSSVTEIEFNAFKDCSGLTSIYFSGTMAQWNAIIKGSGYLDNVPATVVHCTNGDVAL